MEHWPQVPTLPLMDAARESSRPACMLVSAEQHAATMASKLRRSNYNEKRKTPIKYKQLPLRNETYVKIEYNRYVTSEAWVLLPDNTVEHLICYPSGRLAKLARKINPLSSSPYPPSLSVIRPVTEKMTCSVYNEQVQEASPSPTYRSAVSCLVDQVKTAVIRIDKDPPKRTLPSLMPFATYISEDCRSWIGMYNLPSGDFVRRTSTLHDADSPPCYTASELKLVDCSLDEKGRAMVRFFYTKADDELGFWRKVARRLLCA